MGKSFGNTHPALKWVVLRERALTARADPGRLEG